MNQREIDLHTARIAHQLYNHLEETGRFNRHSNPVLSAILEEVYKPLVHLINKECNERIDLYQREIEILKSDLLRMMALTSLRFVGLVGDYRIYSDEENRVEND